MGVRVSAETTVDAVLRVLGDFDLDGLLQTYTDIDPDSVWRRGELQGRPRDCGFNKLLFGDVRPDNATHELVKSLERYRQVILRLPLGSAQIDLGVFGIGSNCGVVLGCQALAAMAEMGLGLSFSYYPSLD